MTAQDSKSAQSSARNPKVSKSSTSQAAVGGPGIPRLYLYLHTHWDREWYWTFGAYRIQLVGVVKKILQLLEDGALDKFMLDGQTALIEDTLEISPELGPRIKALVKAGKLSIGPWYVLADQMLVGGESLVRNLHYGLTLSAKYGGATRVGYCPDTFGHTADLPRILQDFGIDSAVVWRGVPRLERGPLFDWRSPDGSEVLTLDLTLGYYQTQFCTNLAPEALAKELLAFVGLEQYKGRLVDLNQPVRTVLPQIDGALLPVGGDHVGPQADFKAQLAAALAVINGVKVSDAKESGGKELHDKESGGNELDGKKSSSKLSSNKLSVSAESDSKRSSSKLSSTKLSAYKASAGMEVESKELGGKADSRESGIKKSIAKELESKRSDGEETVISKTDMAMTAETVSLNQFFSIVRAAGRNGAPLPLVETELRNNTFAFDYARAYMLDGVLSSRLYLKRENRLSEHKILRQVEPFRALLAAHGVMPYCREEIDFNWKLLLKNHPHDSICGCSIDAVHREMQTRTASLNDGLDILLVQGKEALLNSAAPGGEVRFGARHLDAIDPAVPMEQVAVFNPNSSAYVGPVRVRLAQEAGKKTALPEGFQKLGSFSSNETLVGSAKVPIFKDITIVDGYIDPGPIPGGTLKVVPLAQESVAGSAAESAAESAAGSAAGPAAELTAESAAGSVLDPNTPAAYYPVVPSKDSAPPSKVTSAAGAAIGEDDKAFGSLQLTNEFFSLKFDSAGELIATIRAGAPGAGGTAGSAMPGKVIKLGHQFVDVADAGDSYNFDPIAMDKPIFAKLVSVTPGRKGPLVASLVAHYQIDLPEGLIAKGLFGKRGEADDATKLTVFERAKVRIPHKIESEIILKKGVPIVFFQTTMNNHATDHRLEVVFDTAKPLEHTFSENHFALIKRYHDTNAELNPAIDSEQLVGLGREAPLSRNPCQRFFVGGDNTYMNIGLPEYGVGDSAVSITLLRAFSYLSRNRLRTRGGGAGPNMPTPEGNCLGMMRASYGVAPTYLAAAVAGDKISSEAAPYALADLFEGLPLTFTLPRGGVADKSLSLFTVDDPDIRATATFIDEQERLVIRLLNATSSPKKVTFTPNIAAHAVSLANFDGSGERQLIARSPAAKGAQFSLEFNPCQILTIFCRI